MEATRFESPKAAEEFVLALAKSGGTWKSTRESMGKGTPFHREWETISYNGVPVVEIRRGTPDSGVYRLS